MTTPFSRAIAAASAAGNLANSAIFIECCCATLMSATADTPIEAMMISLEKEVHAFPSKVIKAEEAGVDGSLISNLTARAHPDKVNAALTCAKVAAEEKEYSK